MYKVFIDGAHGTTGLRINEYLSGRPDIQILEIDSDLRKDMETRVSMIKSADERVGPAVAAAVAEAARKTGVARK